MRVYQMLCKLSKMSTYWKQSEKHNLSITDPESVITEFVTVVGDGAIETLWHGERNIKQEVGLIPAISIRPL